MLETLKKSKSFDAFKKAFLNNFSFIVDGIETSSLATSILYLQKTLKKDILIITSEKRDTLFLDLSTFFDSILEFPSLETSPEDSPSPDIIGKRFSILKILLKSKKNNNPLVIMGIIG